MSMTDGGPFDIVVADPPWLFTSNSDAKPGRNARRHYSCMRDEEIEALPLPDIMAPNSLLFLWATVPVLARAMFIAEAWGVTYVSQLVWVKDSPGTGFWVRNRHEIVLIYKRGRFPCPKPAPFADSVLFARKRKHSQKPECLRDRIDAVWPDAAKVELFARRRRAGWACWGNEVGKLPEVAKCAA